MSSPDLEIFITADESPTLITRNEDQYEEKMHHSGGAWSETLYIYLPAMKIAAQEESTKLMSLGLGMAYNEILASALHRKKNPHAQIQIVSFEAVPILREHFHNFIFDQQPSLLSPHYQWILDRAADLFGLEPKALKAHIRSLLESKQLELRGPYPDSLKPEDRFTCVLYDAFSNKMNPELWSEEGLIEHLGKITAINCVFSTYAATGTIKRAMRALGFQKLERPGFAGKRDSSFYMRGFKPELVSEEK